MMGTGWERPAQSGAAASEDDAKVLNGPTDYVSDVSGASAWLGRSCRTPRKDTAVQLGYPEVAAPSSRPSWLASR